MEIEFTFQNSYVNWMHEQQSNQLFFATTVYYAKVLMNTLFFFSSWVRIFFPICRKLDDYQRFVNISGTIDFDTKLLNQQNEKCMLYDFHLGELISSIFMQIN